MRSGLRVVTLLVVSVLAFSTLILAQTATSSLRGTITDPKGAVLQGAIVTLNNAATGFARTTKSGNDGAYQFLEVPPATYILTITSPGFATVKQDRVTLQVSQPATLDIAMQIKGSTEIVEVSGQAPLVNTTDASQGNVFNSTQLSSLPSEGRDPVGILSLQAGVTYLGSNTNQDNSKPNQTEDSRGGSVAGARSDQTNVTVDGLDNNDQLQGYAFQGALRIPLDSIQEFRVTTTNSNADSGRSSGAQVNMVTKSGTNSFHGTLYEYNRSNILDKPMTGSTSRRKFRQVSPINLASCTATPSVRGLAVPSRRIGCSSSAVLKGNEPTKRYRRPTLSPARLCGWAISNIRAVRVPMLPLPSTLFPTESPT
jgi:hypothetical protein